MMEGRGGAGLEVKGSPFLLGLPHSSALSPPTAMGDGWFGRYNGGVTCIDVCAFVYSDADLEVDWGFHKQLASVPGLRSCWVDWIRLDDTHSRLKARSVKLS